MTITRIFQTGFEISSAFEYTGGVGSFNNVTVKTGVYSRRVLQTNPDYFYKTIPATRQIRTGWWYNHMGMNQAGDKRVFSVWTSPAGSRLASLESNVNDLIVDINGTNQDTEAGAATASTWIHLGVDLKIDSSAGWFVVYKNGVEIMRFEGNTGNSDLTVARWGSDAAGAGGDYTFYDDVFCDDTTGELNAAVVPLYTYPYLTSNGTGTAFAGTWVGSDSDTINNYLLVDEVPANTTDYVESVVASQIETFAMTSYTLQANEGCVSVIPTVIAQNVGGTEQIALGIYENSVGHTGTSQIPSNSWNTYYDRITSRPDGSDWDSNQTAINGIEVLIRSEGTYS